MLPNQIKTLIGTIRRKPTRAPDDKTDSEAAAAPTSEKTSIIHDLVNLGPKNAKTVAQAIATMASGEPLDDKELLLENTVSMFQTLPLDSGFSSTVSDEFITMLWHDLPHPPPTHAGPTSYYRQHDGGGNNPWAPEMGKAGSAYARSVPPLKPKGPNLPDPELVFEQLLRRKEPFRPHPSGLNRLFFSFATVVIHECFQSSRENQWINETSSYVDLSTLYGNTEREQPRVRTYENGLIYPDSIASERIMLMPPGVVAVLLMFSRNHNLVAENLLSINESGRYKDWNSLSKEGKVWLVYMIHPFTEANKILHRQDEDIFQLTRNINVGYFATVVLHDYVSAILNTPRANTTWSLDLGTEIKKVGQRVERGVGNVVSVEFAVLYHWHAALSAADDKWMQDVLHSALPELKSVDDMTVELFQKVMKVTGHKLMGTNPKEWTFGGLKRGPNGSFDDVELSEIIKSCIEKPAHAFGANGTPASLKIIDIMGQLQARNVFNVCTMNEYVLILTHLTSKLTWEKRFRRYLNLKPYASFEDWNPDKEVSRAAELLYSHIDNLELYPGLMAECTKPAMPGSGVCPGQTTGRGILDDAVALIRGDRFLSYDFNSTTLTHWGYAKLTAPVGGAYGGKLPELLFKSLPGAWTGTSPYVLLPFYTPQAAKGILKQNNIIDQYDLARPPSGMDIISVHTQEGCKKVFEDRENFRVMYRKAIRQCTDNHDFMIGWDDAKRHDTRSNILHKVFFEEGFEANVTKFYSFHAARLIREHSIKYSGARRSINIVRDVTNVVPIFWLADRFSIPLKTSSQPHGVLSTYEYFMVYLLLFMYQSFNVLPINEWKLRDGAVKAGAALRGIHEAHLKTQSGVKEKIVDWLAKDSPFEVGPDADRIYKALLASKLPIGDLVGDCIGMGAPVAGNITQQASLLIDLYLSPGYESYKERIIELSHRHDPASERELQGFVFEGMRHAGVVPGLPRVAAKDITITDGSRGPITIKAGQTVLIATSKAAMDPIAFPNPEKLDPNRPFSAYTLLGHGLHYCFGARLVGASLAATLKEIFKLKGIRRGVGRQGRFSVVEHKVAGVKMRSYLDGNAGESPIPTSLVLEYDEV